MILYTVRSLDTTPNQITVNKRQRKPKGQSRIDNSETLTTLDTQDA